LRSFDKKIELAAPAGSPEALNAAIGEGADAVYLGLKDFNARLRAKNFSYKELESITDRLHRLDKKVYVTVNTVIEEWELDRVFNLLKYLSQIGVDAVIVQDIGLIKVIGDFVPDLKIHASTQMNISSARAVNFLSKYNVKRVVLSRELTLSEIKNIVANTNSEIEIFCHGAICISASGLCLFSSYFGGRSANKGQCTQACRRMYKDPNGNSKFYFSPKDLSLIRYIPDIIESGVSSLKIEGRMKSEGYVAAVVKAYRYMIDNYQNNDLEEVARRAENILLDDLARKKTTLFFLDKNNKDFIDNASSGETGAKIGLVDKVEKGENSNIIYFQSKSLLEDGDKIKIRSAKNDFTKILKLSTSEKENDLYKVATEDLFEKGDEIFLYKKQSLMGSYKSIIPNSLTPYRTHPGIQKIPAAQAVKINNKNKLKEGIYIKINKFSQFFLLQSYKPEKIIFDLSYKNFREFNDNINKIPFNKENIILSLPPFHREDEDSSIIEEAGLLIEKGFTYFIINNMAQLSFFKNNPDITIICGFNLYSFNSYSISFLFANGVSYIIPPLETSKKNFLESTQTFDSRNFIITIFSFPKLFNINYPFSNYPDYVTDNRDNGFFLIKNSQTMEVIPEKPFSILDKVPFLSKKGFNRFLIDLSDVNLSKNLYKNLVKILQQSGNVDKFERFNWKDGFFRNKEVYQKKEE